MKENNSYNLARMISATKDLPPVFHAPRGNNKLGSIPAWNLLPVVTCSAEACRTCAREGCYAVKNACCHGYDASKNNVLRAWGENTALALQDPATMEKALDAYLTTMETSANGSHYFRVHSAGDFCSVPYALMWQRLALKHPGIKMLAFTKQWEIIRAADAAGTPFHTIENFSLVLSGWTGVVIPADLRRDYKCAYCVERGDAPPAGAIECPGNCETCGVCWSLAKIGKDTYFNKH